MPCKARIYDVKSTLCSSLGIVEHNLVRFFFINSKIRDKYDCNRETVIFPIHNVSRDLFKYMLCSTKKIIIS